MKVAQLFEDRTSADEFIKHWTNDHQYIANHFDEHRQDFEDAHKYYPFTGKKLYRGMNFKTADEMEKFISQPEFTKPTSWTRSIEQATIYSMLDDEYGEDGFGVVISTTPTLKCIAAYDSPRGENEVIMEPGKVSFKVERSGPTK